MVDLANVDPNSLVNPRLNDSNFDSFSGPNAAHPEDAPLVSNVISPQTITPESSTITSSSNSSNTRSYIEKTKYGVADVDEANKEIREAIED